MVGFETMITCNRNYNRSNSLFPNAVVRDLTIWRISGVRLIYSHCVTSPRCLGFRQTTAHADEQ